MVADVQELETDLYYLLYYNKLLLKQKDAKFMVARKGDLILHRCPYDWSIFEFNNSVRRDSEGTPFFATKEGFDTAIFSRKGVTFMDLNLWIKSEYNKRVKLLKQLRQWKKSF